MRAPTFDKEPNFLYEQPPHLTKSLEKQKRLQQNEWNSSYHNQIAVDYTSSRIANGAASPLRRPSLITRV